ncbi:MAG: glycosyltransferase family 9 protein, partial [Chroococcidiopsidaceae cyanobacterium CP_BM_RX_35]|nr:glycosyltransferase family 9 protein [Chroococcidiopsidaceae cyanobacterium CP_BM_RX_35]
MVIDVGADLTQGQIHRLKADLPINQIAIVRALPGLGDLLCAIPAWRSLRAALPETQITLIGLPWAQSFVERFSQYLDRFLEFPGYPGIPEVAPPIRQLPACFANFQKEGFDLALQMHGSGIVSNSFTALLGARVNAGFYLPGQYCPDPKRFLPYPANEPEVWRHLHLMKFLGIPLQGTELEFPLREEDFWALHNIDVVRNLQDSEYVCVHPGASTSDRRW